MKLLHVDSSILGTNSVSRQLSASIVERQNELHSGLQIVYRDLAASPLQHLSGAHLAAAQGVELDVPGLRADIDAGSAALEEFLAADIVVVGAPMYNFGIPSQLKAWVDRLSVAGRTFRYTEQGPIGLAGGKAVILASSRGGSYSEGSPIAFLDHQEAYLQAAFGFMGITDITVIRAENVNVGPEQRAAAITSSNLDIAALGR